MANIRPFRAVRPKAELADKEAALPYDVFSRSEAAAYVKGRDLSFLNIDRPETAFAPDHDMYADDVYDHARELYESWKREGIFIQDEEPCYYVYELCMDGRKQTGIGALSSVDDYLCGICKKHENTVEEKERDRIRHVDRLSAQTGPIFLSYHHDLRIDALVNEAKEQPPIYDIISEDGIGHRLWCISEKDKVERLTELFSELPCTYIADGHHRAASAVKVALKRRAEEAEAGESEATDRPFHEYDGFLSVLFPDTELRIYDYNRVVSDLSGYEPVGFLRKLAEYFDIRETEELMHPEHKFEIGMYLDHKSYMLRLKDRYAEERKGDPQRSLDVSVLQDLVLDPLLSIKDPRTDGRISFVGGIRGLSELVRMADDKTGDGSWAAAFAMYPTSMQELFSVADAGLLMPPKSTWFEPKLRSGFLIHEF